MSAIDVAEWGARAGWSPVPPAVDLTIAVAVALATSGGNPGKSGGLFGLGNSGDGPTQTKQAYEQQKAKGWSSFRAFKFGTYLIYMPAAGVAVTAMPAAKIIDDPGKFASGVVDGLKDAAGNLPGDILGQAKTAVSLAVKAGAWLGNANNWARILLVVLGGGMVIGGVTLAAGSGIGGPVTGAAGKVVGGVTKVAKVAGGK